MFLECSLLIDQLNTLNRIVVTEKCVIIMANVFWIGQTIIKTLPKFKKFMPIEEDISSNHLNTVWDQVNVLTFAIPELLVDCSSALVVLNTSLG
jgi:hypothetical protein